MSNNKKLYIAASAFRIFGRISHNSIELLEEQDNEERIAVASFHGLATRITQDVVVNAASTSAENGQSEMEEKKEILPIGHLHDFLLAYCVRKQPALPHEGSLSQEECNTWVDEIVKVMKLRTVYYDVEKDYERSQNEHVFWLPTTESKDQVILYGEKEGEDDALRLWDRLRRMRPRINELRLHYPIFGMGLGFFWNPPANSNAIYTLALRLMELPLYTFAHLIAPGVGNSILDENTIKEWIQECRETEQAQEAVIQIVSSNVEEACETVSLVPSAT